jgi:hydroxymethylpyrimidine pyrophosphatase-like HAD family hydrolase
MSENRPKTIFCDIDGTLVKHMAPSEATSPYNKMEVIPGTIEKLLEWEKKGYHIVLTTGRRNTARKQTEQQLSEAGIIYDQLVMGFGGGVRYLINDMKEDGRTGTAFAVNLRRNTEGIKDLKI